MIIYDKKIHIALTIRAATFGVFFFFWNENALAGCWRGWYFNIASEKSAEGKGGRGDAHNTICVQYILVYLIYLSDMTDTNAWLYAMMYRI